MKSRDNVFFVTLVSFLVGCGAVTESLVVAPPTIALKFPRKSPGHLSTPEFIVSNVDTHYQVELFRDSSCTLSVSKRVTAKDKSVNIIASTPIDDNDTMYYAKATHPNATQSECSSNGVVYRYNSTPPPPALNDPLNLEALANEQRTVEFSKNPGLYDMNAHWAYARGLTGAGESIGMLDTGLYAIHEEFKDGLHGETRYTVIGEAANDPTQVTHTYFNLAERAPAGAYPLAPRPDNSQACNQGRGGIACKFYDYGHGTAMASTAAARRNDKHAHGMAFDAKLLFLPTRERGSLRISVLDFAACH